MYKVKAHEAICKELNKIYERKNADYGDSFGKSFKEYGLTMACIRLDDKLNRVKALRTKEAQVADESIEDTLLDLANYAIMTLVEMRGDEPDGLPKLGDHSSSCLLLPHHSACPCNTCRRDNSHDMNTGSCCSVHGRNCYHPNTPCPDYVPEESADHEA